MHAQRTGPIEDVARGDELCAEQAYLRRALLALRGMFEQVRNTAVAAGDPVADKVTNAYLRIDRERRLAALGPRDDSIPLFFGRLDYRQDHPVSASASGSAFDSAAALEPAPASVPASVPAPAVALAEVPAVPVYLGRRLVREEAGDDPLVVDWRADVARPFYRAHRADPMGLRVRRRFGFVDGELTAFEDEAFGPGAATSDDENAATAATSLLEQEIQRPRSGPMRDIVATIQPEQDEIVRAGLELSICVQGAPGTGKTAVGLHRAAYLLYTYRERLARSGVLVVGPNRAFLGYIASVLPALGEFTVEQRSILDLLDTPSAPAAPAASAARGSGAAEPEDVAVLKGDARMATVIRRALHGAIQAPTGPVTIVTREGRWTVAEQEVTSMLTALRSGSYGYGAGRAMLARRIGAAAARRAELAGAHITDAGIEALARSRPVRAAVEAIWPKADGAKLIRRLFTDPEFLAAAAGGVLTEAEQALLVGHRSRGRSIADAYCGDEARHLIERVPGFGHVIVDEAQDLSAMQCRAIGRRCAQGSLTVLGDLAQGTSAWAAGSWQDLLTHLGKPATHVEVLDRSHRVPAEILGYANRLLPSIAPHVPPATSVRHVPGALTVVRAAPDRLVAEVTAQARVVLRNEGSTAVLVADRQLAAIGPALRDAGLPFIELREDTAPGRFALVPASLAKGLEFDHVILAEPAAVVAGEPGRTNGLRRLYVLLTRAVTSLTVVHADDLPAEL
ncbi:ATP-binding protein [Parafrankia sp. EUN1f]|uniref:HelD family protein n=1 Tax=Parafrankia sp. EUN1f TaxID=102897 RepID=UPI0001C46395|nr:ATP-binding protein [Parafrankia sp. EUN1f]EFC81364.1 Superfamily I DNA and RNA helicase-like protein [Parafrankia sp. EUN1f]